MNSMPLRIDGDLINQARASGQVFHRSIAQQLEHWASLGQALEKVLTVSSVAKVKGLNRPIDLERVLAHARSAAGTKKTLSLLARKRGPLYGISPDHPKVLLRYEPDGTAVDGKMIKGEFIPTTRFSKAKAGR